MPLRMTGPPEAAAVEHSQPAGSRDRLRNRRLEAVRIDRSAARLKRDHPARAEIEAREKLQSAAVESERAGRRAERGIRADRDNPAVEIRAAGIGVALRRGSAFPVPILVNTPVPSTSPGIGFVVGLVDSRTPWSVMRSGKLRAGASSVAVGSGPGVSGSTLD